MLICRMSAESARRFTRRSIRFISIIRLSRNWRLKAKQGSRETAKRTTRMAYSVRHITSFRYEPAVRESVMEVRMQPRTDFRQRCLSFTLDVQPRATLMVYRDFYGNAVHHFDIPQKHALIEVTAQAIVDVLPAQDFAADDAGGWGCLTRAGG